MSALRGGLLGAGSKSDPRPSEAAAARLPLAPAETPTPALVAVVAAVVFGLVAQGGTFERGRLLVGALLLTAVVLGLGTGSLRAADVRTVVPLAVMPLCVWALARAAMAGDVRSGSGIALLLAGMAIVFAVLQAESRSSREKVLSVMVIAGAGLAVTGWLGVALRWEPLALAPAGVWRAATVLTYSNAAAAVLVALGLVATGLYVARPTLRIAVVTMLLLLGAGATLSRAGLLAGLVGLALLAGLLGVRRLVATLLAPAVGALVAWIGLLPSLSSGVDGNPGLATAALAAGLGLTIAVHNRGRRRRPRGLLVAAPAVLLIGALAISASDTGWVSGRLHPADRWARSEAAVQLLGEHPVVGVGPGPLWLTWETSSGRTVGAWHVHNEYLDLIVQLGMIGGALLGWLLGALAAAVWEGRRCSVRPEIWAGIAAALVGLAVHSAFDFLWHLPAIPLLVAVLVGVAAPPTLMHAGYRRETHGYT